jgi:hypothetical protein
MYDVAKAWLAADNGGGGDAHGAKDDSRALPQPAPKAHLLHAASGDLRSGHFRVQVSST